MAASFKGLYLCPPKGERPKSERRKGERPSHVRVQDAEQGEMTLPLDAYEAHGGQPPWQSLPWQGEAGPLPDDHGKHGPEISM